MAMDFAASLDAMLSGSRDKAKAHEAKLDVKPMRSAADIRKAMDDSKKMLAHAKASAKSSSLLTVTAKPSAVGILVKKETLNVITAVTAGSQGATLGLRLGMTIMTVAGAPVSTAADVTKALAAAKRAGRPYKIVLERTGAAKLEAMTKPLAGTAARGAAVAERVSAALSKKEATPAGHKVTTVARGARARAGAPAEPGGGRQQRQRQRPAAQGATAAEDVRESAAEREAAAAARAEEQAALARRRIAEEGAERVRKAKEAKELSAFKSEFHKGAAATKQRQNGQVTVKYRLKAAPCNIRAGVATAASVDAALGLSAVLPGCVVHLSVLDAPALERRLREDGRKAEDGGGQQPSSRYRYFLREEPEGSFRGLLDGEAYWAYVNEDTAAERAEMELAKEGWVKHADVSGNSVREVGGGAGNEAAGAGAAARQEGCSCIEGNPCVDEYICRDWHNRFEIAKTHGWGGRSMGFAKGWGE